MVYNLTDKAIKLADEQFHDVNLKIVKNILSKNSYPKKFINDNMKKRINKLRNTNQPIIIEKEKNPFIVLPHYNQHTDNIKQKQKKLEINTLSSIDNHLSHIIIQGKR